MKTGSNEIIKINNDRSQTKAVRHRSIAAAMFLMLLPVLLVTACFPNTEPVYPELMRSGSMFYSSSGEDEAMIRTDTNTGSAEYYNGMSVDDSGTRTEMMAFVPHSIPNASMLLGVQAEPEETEKPDESDEPEEPETPKKIAYITIDDGPSRSITPGILDLLAKEGIKATFFILPQPSMRGLDNLFMRIIDEGHEMGNHSFTHRYGLLYDKDDTEPFKNEVIAAHEYILDKYGYTMKTFRFPGGMMGRKAEITDPRKAILDELGYKYYDWNIDSGDTNRSAADRETTAIINKVLDNTRDRERLIILLHDSWDKQSTLEALPEIISGLRKQGYSFDILKNYRGG